MKSLLALCVCLTCILTPFHAFGESSAVFTGLPIVKISEGGSDRVPERLQPERAINYECVIREAGGKYYWGSRENAELIRQQSGAFVTYIALNGSGYVRVIDPAFKGAASLMSETEAEFDYAEHLLIGLRSVTYYGKSQ